MRKRYFTTGLLIFTILTCMAQIPLNHEKKLFVSPEGKIFVNKALPVYFKISTTPDDKSPSYTMPSEKTPKYANPMFFDSEGRNTLRSPWAVDTITKKIVEPKMDIQFQVYADGIAPKSTLNIINANKFIKNGIVFFGKELQTVLAASDELSGLDVTYISINKSSYEASSKLKPIFDTEKEYIISYYSVDKVGNVETPKTEKFQVDLTAPKTTFTIIGESKGKVLSSKASVSLTAKDSLSGVNKIVYSINDGPEKVYSFPIPLSVLKDGKSKINYFAIDNVGNKEESKVIATSTDKINSNDESSTFSFYIDKEAPEVGFEIEGDKSTGKLLYISGRSKFKIIATDEKSGVDKIMYSINNPLLNQTYTSPIALTGIGLQTVYFAATDNVGNAALAKSQQIFIDKTSPNTSFAYNGRLYTNRDTTFINGDTKIILAANESGSGLQSLQYSIDGNSKSVYTIPFSIDKEGFHNFEYLSTDNVNNEETLKRRSFFVDNKPPQIHYHFSVKAIGEKTVRDEKYTIYPSNTMLYIAATDNATGGEHIEYKINGKQSLNNIPVKGLIPGNYEIEITAFDMVHNKSTETLQFAIEK